MAFAPRLWLFARGLLGCTPPPIPPPPIPPPPTPPPLGQNFEDVQQDYSFKLVEAWNQDVRQLGKIVCGVEKSLKRLCNKIFITDFSSEDHTDYPGQ
jgi:hypothetical protein